MFMIVEDILSTIFSFLSSDSVDISSYIDAVGTIIEYIDYLDPIVPVGLLISCGLIILWWTVICCVVRLVIYIVH